MRFLMPDAMTEFADDGDEGMPMVVIPIVVMPLTTLLNWWCEA